MHVRGTWPVMPYTIYTVYTPIGGKSRCRTSCDLQDHSMQARKSAGKRSTLALKPMRKDTQSPKQEQSVAPQNGHLSNKKLKKKKRKEYLVNSCISTEFYCSAVIWMVYYICKSSGLWNSSTWITWNFRSVFWMLNLNSSN